MVLITFAVHSRFRPEKAEEMCQRRLRTLHLIADLVMLGMGIVIVAGFV